MSVGSNFSRCPWCDLLAFQDGVCADCGFTGACAYCDYMVAPHNPYPMYHDGECADEAHREGRADRGDRLYDRLMRGR